MGDDDSKFSITDPRAIYGTMITLALSVFGGGYVTRADKFTGTEGRELAREISETQAEIDKLEDFVEILTQRGPVDVRQGQKENTELLKHTNSLLIDFTHRELAVRAQHEDLETLVREILREQRENCRMKI